MYIENSARVLDDNLYSVLQNGLPTNNSSNISTLLAKVNRVIERPATHLLGQISITAETLLKNGEYNIIENINKTPEVLVNGCFNNKLNHQEQKYINSSNNNNTQDLLKYSDESDEDRGYELFDVINESSSDETENQQNSKEKAVSNEINQSIISKKSNDQFKNYQNELPSKLPFEIYLEKSGNGHINGIKASSPQNNSFVAKSFHKEYTDIGYTEFKRASRLHNRRSTILPGFNEEINYIHIENNNYKLIYNPISHPKDTEEYSVEDDNYLYHIVKSRKEQLFSTKSQTSEKRNILKNLNKNNRPLPSLIPLNNFTDSIAAENCDKNFDEIDLISSCEPDVIQTQSRGTNTERLFHLHNSSGLSTEEELHEYWHSIHDNFLNKSHLVSDQKNSMGFDIVGKIKRFLNKTSILGDNNTEASRKRRLNNTASCSNSDNPHQIKYRKVESHFPKYITHTLDDDSHNCSEVENFQTYGMSQRKPLHSTSASTNEPRYRKSIFSKPEVTKKLVRNNYADVEFSDDEDCELLNSAVRNVSKSLVKDQPVIHTIPILSQSRDRPKLLENNYRNLLNIRPPITGIISHIDVPYKPTYSQLFQQNNRILQNSSSISSGTSSSSSVRILKDIDPSFQPNSLAMKKTNSILKQEKDSNDHTVYQQFLEQFVPRLYGRDTSSLICRNDYKLLFSKQQDRKSLSNKKNAIRDDKPDRPVSYDVVSLLDDDDDVEIKDNSKIVKTDKKKSPKKSIPNGLPATIVFDDIDDNISDIIDLSNDNQKVSSVSKPNKAKSVAPIKLPYVGQGTSVADQFSVSPYFQDNWLEKHQLRWNTKKQLIKERINELTLEANQRSEERKAAELVFNERFKRFQIVDPDLIVLDDFVCSEEKVEPEFPELTPDINKAIQSALTGPNNDTLISKFNLNIARRDIHTLIGCNWLNDEVINFYMSLLTERGEGKDNNESLPSVYAMNTFFVERLSKSGYAGVKRWTRKVDIFSKDIMPVPVHVGGVHWCMAIIHFKNRTIKYYDSMGTPNLPVLQLLEEYLHAESLDKRKIPWDKSGFVIECAKDVPRQMNGSDCGVFSCMFAEYITRNQEITFKQENMEYFRRKMIYEIVTGKLMH